MSTNPKCEDFAVYFSKIDTIRLNLAQCLKFNTPQPCRNIG